VIDNGALLEQCRPAVTASGGDCCHFQRSVLDLEHTLPKILLRHRRSRPHQVAMRKKDFGIWNSFDWEQVYQHVKDMALGLKSLGMQRGDKLCVVGDNDPQWYWAELAAQSLGGICVGLYTDAMPADMEYIINDCDGVFVFAKDQEQTDKVLEIREKIPKIRKVIYWDASGMYRYRNDRWLLDNEKLLELGRAYEKRHPEFFAASVEAGEAGDLAILSYTSGTTSLPKGVMLSHEYLLNGGIRLATAFAPRQNDEYLSFVSPAWISEQLIMTLWLVFGTRINFPEEPETVMENIREIGARFFLLGPMQWQGIMSQVQMKIFDTGPVRRFLYETCLAVGYRAAQDKIRGNGAQSLRWKLLAAMANAVCLRHVRDNLGLSKLQYGLTGGSALGPDVIRWFDAIGVRIKDAYGLTELTPATIHRAKIKAGTSGPPVPGVEVKIAHNGEIFLRAAKMFDGYYKKPAETRAMLVEGWIRTGDCGTFDEDGHLIVYDRLKDMLPLKGGGTYSPTYIQNRLKFSPYIKEVLVVGGVEREFLFGLITIDFEIVGKWAEKQKIAYTTFVDLSQKPEVYRLVRAEVLRVNATLPNNAKIVRCALLHKEFDPDEGELTKTRKLRRGFLEQRYAELIEAAYAGKEKISVEAQVKYRDGKVGKIRTDLRVHTVEEDPAARTGARYAGPADRPAVRANQPA
jgi:long-chain acyl-CoA synthetase